MKIKGPRRLSPDQRARRQQNSEVLADKLDALADAASSGNGSYAQFENILNKLHALGFFPEISLISAVAKAM
jgi:hypothetical protein